MTDQERAQRAEQHLRDLSAAIDKALTDLLPFTHSVAHDVVAQLGSIRAHAREYADRAPVDGASRTGNAIAAGAFAGPLNGHTKAAPYQAIVELAAGLVLEAASAADRPSNPSDYGMTDAERAIEAVLGTLARQGALGPELQERFAIFEATGGHACDEFTEIANRNGDGSGLTTGGDTGEAVVSITPMSEESARALTIPATRPGFITEEDAASLPEWNTPPASDAAGNTDGQAAETDAAPAESEAAVDVADVAPAVSGS